jgi:hypothetical protein
VKLRNLSTLQLALGVSIAVHAVLLTVRFVDPQAIERAFRDTPLEVILINARGQVAPDQALPSPRRAWPAAARPTAAAPPAPCRPAS